MMIQACNPKHGSRTSRPDPRSGLLDPIRTPLRGPAARDREGPVPYSPDNAAAWNHRPFSPCRPRPVWRVGIALIRTELFKDRRQWEEIQCSIATRSKPIM